jgi:hypothetical protein
LKISPEPIDAGGRCLNGVNANIEVICAITFYPLRAKSLVISGA